MINIINRAEVSEPWMLKCCFGLNHSLFCGLLFGWLCTLSHFFFPVTSLACYRNQCSHETFRTVLKVESSCISKCMQKNLFSKHLHDKLTVTKLISKAFIFYAFISLLIVSCIFMIPHIILRSGVSRVLTVSSWVTRAIYTQIC